MTIKINDGGIWKDANASINVGGTWKAATSVKINVGGVWKEVGYVAPVVTVAASYTSGNFDSSAPYLSGSGYRINPTGALEERANPDGLTFTTVATWLTSGTASDVEWRITTTSTNTTIYGVTVGAWNNAGTLLEFYIFSQAAEILTWAGTLEFRDANTLITLDTSTISIEVDNTGF